MNKRGIGLAVGCVAVGVAIVGGVVARAGEPPAPIYSTSIRVTNQFGTSGDDEVTGTGVARNGDLYVGGQTTGLLGSASAGSTDAFVAKYDRTGALKWTRQFGSDLAESPSRMAVTPSGDAYLVGYTFGDIDGSGPAVQAGAGDAFIAKYDRNGKQKWVRQFGSTGFDGLYGVATGADGSVYAVGEADADVDGSGPAVVVGGADALIVKYDRNGKQKWVRQFGTSGNDFVDDIAVRPNGDIAVTGATDGTIADTSGGFKDAWAARYDKNGNLKWIHQYPGAGNELGDSVAWGPTGEIFVSGYSNADAFGAGGAGDSDIFVAHLSPTGTLVKSIEFGSAVYEDVPTMAVNSKGAIFVHGMTDGSLPGFTSLGGTDQYVARFDSDLNTVWIRQFGTPQNDLGAWSMPITTIGNSGLLIGGGTTGAIFGHVNSGGDDAFFSVFPTS